MLKATQHNDGSWSLREERQLRRALHKELESYGLDNARTMAETLVTMGITQDIQAFIPLLQTPYYQAILDNIYNLSTQRTNSENIVFAVDRAAKVVFALKTYTHQNASSDMVKANLIEGMDVVLTLCQHWLKQGVEVIKRYEEISEMLCYPDELNQVWTNLIHNAIQAMGNKGTLEIDIHQQPCVRINQVDGLKATEEIVVCITDSGPGIPEQVQERMFEPFFTTKGSGEGSGLGLDIVRKIIEKHAGRIDVASRPGRTTFQVWLPIREY